MTLASLAGFALVFVVCAWALSACASIALAWWRPALERMGPMAERGAAVAAAIVPAVIAAFVIATLVGQSLFGVDHCTSHDHHAHLCLVHGAAWIDRASVVVMLAIAGAMMLGRGALLAASYVRGARSIRALHAISRDAGDVQIVESDRPFCFTTGSAIYVSSGVWSSLSEVERTALVAHESAHGREGDLRMRAVLEVFLVFAAPLVGDRVRARWLGASERLCDARAAAATGRPDSVASAMVSLCRLHTARPLTSLGFTPAQSELALRVRAVLAGGPIGERAAAILRNGFFALCVVVVVAALVAADPLHHAFETLLG